MWLLVIAPMQTYNEKDKYGKKRYTMYRKEKRALGKGVGCLDLKPHFK